MPLGGTKRALSGSGSSGRMNRRGGGTLQIRLGHARGNLDPSYGTKAWETLASAIRVIYSHGDTMNLSFEELYRLCYNMVLYEYGDLLYNGFQDVVAEHLENVRETIEKTPQDTFVAEINRQWWCFTVSIKKVGEILMYMDRHYVRRRKMSVHDLSVALFRDKVILMPKVLDRLINSLFDSIDQERKGEQIEWQELSGITRLLVDLGNDSKTNRNVYFHYFEKPLLKRTAEFYAMESQVYLSESTCSEYLKRMELRVHQEVDRANRYLDARTEKELKAVTENELLCIDMEKILEMPNSGFRWMLRNNKYEDIHRAFRLYNTVDGGEKLLCSLLKKELIQSGMEYASEKSKLELVDCCLTVKTKYDLITTNAFYVVDPETKSHEIDKNFLGTMNAAFAEFLNSFEKMPEYLSLYVDKLLRQDFKGATEEEMESKLDKLIAVFRHLHYKDAFERFFRQHLAKRLLYGRSVSEEAERSFAIKLREECGSFYTHKLESMFNDMKTSAETNGEFREYMATRQISLPKNIDLNVSILTTGSWPVVHIPPCTLPTEITKALEIFVEHYKLSHAGRVLSWQTSMGTAELKAVFAKSSHELAVTTYQMCVLMLFNTHDQLTYRDITQSMGLPETELCRTLQSLACAKYKILMKEPKGRDINPDDVFSFNNDFTNRGYRIRIPTISSTKETEEEKADTLNRVEQDRKPQIEAAIVRIMKDRRTLDHNLLIAEVSTQLSPLFLPNITDIKVRIESLIDRDFLMRVDDRTYSYIA